MRAASLFVAGALLGSVAADDGQDQVAELQEQLTMARTAAQTSDSSPRISAVTSLEQQLDDVSQQLRSTRRKLRRTTRVARQRQKKLTALKDENATLAVTAAPRIRTSASRADPTWTVQMSDTRTSA